MVDSMDSPHGDQVERTAAAAATSAARTVMQTVMSIPSSSRVSSGGGGRGHGQAGEPKNGVSKEKMPPSAATIQ